MTIRLYDLEKLTSEKWRVDHQWRYHNGKIEFGIETSDGIEWTSFVQAPNNIMDIVLAYRKMQSKIELREEQECQT